MRSASDWIAPEGGLPGLFDWVAPEGGDFLTYSTGLPPMGVFRLWRERADAVAANQADKIELRMGFQKFGGGRLREPADSLG